MELWEFCACTEGFAQRQELRATEALIASWQTGNFTGAAFAGKLKGLKHYMQKHDPSEKQAAPKISKEKFYEKLARAKAKKGGNT